MSITTDHPNETLIPVSGVLGVTSVVNAATGYRISGAAASGNYLRGNGTNFVSSAIQSGDVSGLITGSYGCRGNRSLNNTGTPDTKVDLVAAVVILKNSSNQIVIQDAPSTVTNDVSVSGSTANGRDQSGAFSASSWIHFYWIWNGTTLASLSSTVAPPTGPTLPSGYTHWAYSHAQRFDGSSHLLRVEVRGSWVTYGNLVVRPVALNAGAATVETTVDVSAIIPPNALMYTMDPSALNLTTDGAGAVNVAYAFRSGTGVNLVNATFNMTGLGVAAGQNFAQLATLLLPNIGQQFFYQITNTVGSGTLTLVALGYSIPNGDS